MPHANAPASMRPKSIIEKARAAQKAWRNIPLKQRCDAVLAMVEALISMKDDMVPELAHMMGRPVRYGGEFGGVKDRADYMASIAETSLANIEIENSPAFRRYIARDALGVVFVIAPWNYPYLTAINTIAPALMAGNAVDLEARHADASGRRSLPNGGGQKRPT